MTTGVPSERGEEPAAAGASGRRQAEAAPDPAESRDAAGDRGAARPAGGSTNQGSSVCQSVCLSELSYSAVRQNHTGDTEAAPPSVLVLHSLSSVHLGVTSSKTDDVIASLGMYQRKYKTRNSHFMNLMK